MTRIIAALIFTIALRGQTSRGDQALPHGRQTGPFFFLITSDKQQYDAGEPIVVTSVLRNGSDHDISIFATPRISFYSMDVRMPGPSWLPFRDRSLLSKAGEEEKFPGHTSATSHILKPGGEIVDHFELNKIYMMPVMGEYRVTFYFPGPDYVGKGIVVISNELVFTIAGKNEK